MGASRSQYATPYGAYGPRQGQVPNRNVYGGGYAPRPTPQYAAPAYGAPAPTYMRSAPVYGGYRAPTYVAQPSYSQPIFASAPTYAAPPMMAAPAYAAPAYTQAYAPAYSPAYASAPVSYAAPMATSYASPLMSYGAPAIAAPSYGSAIQLDAADGVLDGRYFGTQVGISAPQYNVPSFAPAGYGQGFGLVAAPSQGAAFALDASDGVIDGRYFGSQVAVAAPVQQFASAYNPGVVAAPSQGAAFALDAADGLIDGRYFGAQVGVAAPAYTGY